MKALRSVRATIWGEYAAGCNHLPDAIHGGFKSSAFGPVASTDAVRAKLGKILQGADPPHSEAAVQRLLEEAGFGTALRFFSSLFWGAWVASKDATQAGAATQLP